MCDSQLRIFVCANKSPKIWAVAFSSMVYTERDIYIRRWSWMKREKMASCMFVAYIFKSCVSFGPLHDGHHLMCVKAKRPFLFMNIYCNNNHIDITF